MINDKYILASSPIFSLAPGEESTVNLELDKSAAVQDGSLLAIVLKKPGKIIVEGKSEPHASIEVSVGNNFPINTTSNNNGNFTVTIKHPRLVGHKLIVTIKAHATFAAPKIVTIIV
ncbi:Ig-like domain-containing protein [Bacillus salipaludis]|uniref:Ig-like domain-containing protein n=1 Tax=Bacillus salipaludis TaxID=2547811 RepID=UPI003D201785